MRKSLTLSLMLAALAGGARATPIDDVQALGWLAGAWVQQDDTAAQTAKTLAETPTEGDTALNEIMN